MKRGRGMRIAADAAYFLGVAVIVGHLGLALFAGDRIPYPDAMLPMAYLEIVLLRLSVWALPELLISVWFYWSHGPLPETPCEEPDSDFFAGGGLPVVPVDLCGADSICAPALFTGRDAGNVTRCEGCLCEKGDYYE